MFLRGFCPSSGGLGPSSVDPALVGGVAWVGVDGLEFPAGVRGASASAARKQRIPLLVVARR
jgi:hypothetical protein